MKAVLIVALCVLALAAATTSSSDLLQWQEFKNTYAKSYANAGVERERFNVFKANLLKIKDMNRKEPGATFGVTKFADLTTEEFKAYRGMRNPKGMHAPVTKFTANTPTVPAEINWATIGATSPVKNQGQCGSCWAFSATEQIESMWYLQHPGTKILDLSPQQIVDCDSTCDGCNGGFPTWAYDYVQKAGGLENATIYPYLAEQETCRFNVADEKATVTGFSWLSNDTHKDEGAMLDYVGTTGPLSIAVDASSWQFYKFGVIRVICGTTLDHAVQIVGYATETGLLKTPYWIVRNSWGADWGEQGFVRVERNKNLCGIAEFATTVNTV
jgi:cathepsin F